MGRHIGLVGPKHSGKSTAAQHLVRAHGFQRIALADPLKNLAVEMVNIFHAQEGLPAIDRAYLDAHKDEVFVPFLQWLGSEYGREFHNTPTRWIDKFLAHSYASPVPVVCDDVRFPNEADTLRDNGFLIVKIARRVDARMASLAAAGVPTDVHAHQSETAIAAIVPDIIIAPEEMEGARDLCTHIDWCVAFQQACADLTEMSAYVPYTAAPGYNADFSERAAELWHAYERQTINITNHTYGKMFSMIRQHAGGSA